MSHGFSPDFESLPVWVDVLIILAAFFLVGKGAQWVVESAARLAKRLGISELVIGLTVVALGTSAPEFAVTLIAAFRGQGDISVGNIVGSNIFNLGFILGGCAVVRVIPTNRILLRRDGSMLAFSTLLLLFFVGWDLRLDYWEGAVLLALLFVYLSCLYWTRQMAPGSEEEVERLTSADRKSLWYDVAQLLGGLAAILLGSHLLIGAATAVAGALGISQWVIAVTIVAAGTSLPELAVSLVGVWEGRYGISAGNVIGSDIFNLVGVLGLAGVLSPVEVEPMARVSMAALFGMVLVVLIFMRTGWRLTRLEGIALLVFAAARWGFDFAAH